MKGVAGVLLVLIPAFGFSQMTETLTFREKTHDFGSIAEEKGPVTHEFNFTNTSPQPVTISGVQTTCGCTTPGWTKQPVAPGKVGFVKASFDPTGRPGFFNKTLTVTTDIGTTIVLVVKGSVTTGATAGAQEFTTAIGNLRLRSKSFTMGSAYINKEPATKLFQVMNGSDAVLRILSIGSPDYIVIEVPEVIQPGQQAQIKVTYDARKRNKFGFVSDNIELKTNDALEPDKTITVFTTLEEYYSPPTLDELKTAPQAVISEPSIDAGQYPAGSTLERTITVHNRGKKELSIKALVGNCSCITAEASKRAVRAGDSTKIKINFKPQTRGGTQQKAVMMYTNDPRNPVQVINVSVYINE